MNFENWLDRFLEEKNIDLFQEIEIETGNHFGYTNVGDVVSALSQLSIIEKGKIKNTFVKIDFRNGDVLNFITYLANGIVKSS